MTGGSLSGRRIITTRDAPGVLDARLAALGADVVHVPMIEIADPPDDSAAEALHRLDEYDWVVVTSRHGARLVAPALAAHPQVRAAAVGSNTAGVLGADVEVLVPARQTASDLLVVFPAPAARDGRVLVVQGDRSDTDLVDGLRSTGYMVDAVIGYVTRAVTPTADQRRSVDGADAVVFASGSAATAWRDAFGVDRPPAVVAIGPTTARVAEAAGFGVDGVAADHSVDGLVECVQRILGRSA